VPDLTTDQLLISLGAVAIAALIALLLALGLALRVRKLRREYALLRGEGGERDIIAALGHAARKVEGLDRRVDDVERAQVKGVTTARQALQRFALVRYDAFEDMGGRLSFSAALLDAHGDGLVITSINGRSETRTYAKPVRNLSSEHNLSEEEREAIAIAFGGEDRNEARSPASPTVH
jgi:uncharacterized protein YlxW (UPF0749 family)